MAVATLVSGPVARSSSAPPSAIYRTAIEERLRALEAARARGEIPAGPMPDANAVAPAATVTNAQ